MRTVMGKASGHNCRYRYDWPMMTYRPSRCRAGRACLQACNDSQCRACRVTPSVAQVMLLTKLPLHVASKVRILKSPVAPPGLPCTVQDQSESWVSVSPATMSLKYGSHRLQKGRTIRYYDCKATSSVRSCAYSRQFVPRHHTSH